MVFFCNFNCSIIQNSKDMLQCCIQMFMFYCFNILLAGGISLNQNHQSFACILYMVFMLYPFQVLLAALTLQVQGTL
jgi:hypothetical protein